MVNVTIGLGRHTMPVPYGMKKFMKEVITVILGITQGNFEVHLGKQVKGGMEDGIKYLELLPGNSGILVKVQPSGRGGRHICTLKFPDMYKNRLSEFAEMLREKCGQEEVTPEDEIEELQFEGEVNNQDVAAPVDVATERKVEGIDLSKQEYLEESVVLAHDMLILILSEIYEKKGMEWIEKKILFRIIKSLKLSFPDNKLIGRLLRMGYLEKNPDNPLNSSRLSSSAKFLLEEVRIEKMTRGMELVAYDEEELKVLKNFKEIRLLAEQHVLLQENLNSGLHNFEILLAEKERLRDRIEKFNNLARAKMEAIVLRIAEEEGKISKTKQEITPRMQEATRRYEILTSEFSE